MIEGAMKFYEKFVNFLKSSCKDSCLMLIDNKDWKFKNFSLIEDLSEAWITSLVEAWRYVSFSVGDAAMVTDSFLTFAREMQDNEDDSYLQLNLDDHPGDCKYWLARANELKSSLAIKKHQVKYKPVVLVDVDLKDQERLLKDGGFIPAAADATYLKTLSAPEKIKLLRTVCNLDLIVTETEPSLVVFTGGGFHIWYTQTEETDADRYAALHKMICEKLSNLLPDIVIDSAASHITQNIRLPYTYNGKYSPEIACEVVYEADEFKTPDWITELHNSMEVVQSYNGGTSINVGSPEAYSVNGLLTVSAKSQTNKSKREGLRNFRRDPRMWDFIQRYLTFEGICSYTKTPLHNYSRRVNPEKDNDYYLLCSSPLRKDDHPSFMAFNSGLFCRDMGRNDKVYDFGTLMRLLLVKAKERLGFASTETTRYEADFHCVFATYINYVQKTGTSILPMLEMNNSSKKREGIDTEFDPKLLKKVFPGKQYYCNLQVTLDGWVKQFRKAGEWSDDFMRDLLAKTSDIYYFYDAKQAHSGQAYLTNAVVLCVLHYFNQCNLCIQFDRPGKFQVYVVNRELGLHEPWETWVVNHTITGHKEDLAAKTAIQSFIVNSNMADSGSLPKGTSRLFDYVFGVLSGMVSMPEELATYLPTTVVPNDELTVKQAIIQYLTTQVVPGANISPCDIKISLLNSDHYIEFDNCFVLYLTVPSEYHRIGKILPKEEKGVLLRKAVVDLRINHQYIPGSLTPKFDKFVSDMTYDGNCFDQALKYFTASLLYSPRMHPGRVWFLLGRDGDNGKSVIGTVVAGLLGERYTTTKDLSDLTATTDKGKNTRNELIHSLLNVTQDSSRNKLEGVFKSLIEGEPVSVRALYRKEYDVCLPTHYMVNANSLPATWGETQPLVKRIVLTRVDRVVPREKRIDNLGNKIVNEEASGIWPKIIATAPLYLDKGINGFISANQLAEMNYEFFEQNDVFTFMRDYTFYNKKAGWHISGKQFKVLYNKYRNMLSKQSVSSDNLISEAESFARKIYQGRIDDDVLDKGFGYRSSKFRGLPIRIYVPPKNVGNFSALDSEPDGTPPPEDADGNTY